jgi:ABC-type multidrug transport system fused ATPase/permease subunit
MFHEGVIKALHGRTRLLVTNQMNNVLSYCDKILRLNHDGEVLFYGHYTDYAIAVKSPRDTFMLSTLMPSPTEQSSNQDHVIQGSANENVSPTRAMTASISSYHGADHELVFKHPSSTSSKDIADEREDTSTVVSMADTIRSHLDYIGKNAALPFATYWSYVTHGGIAIAILTSMLLLAAETLQISASLWLAQWGQQGYNDDINDDDTTFFSLELYYLHIYSTLQVSSVLLLSISRLCVMTHRYRMSHAFHEEMLHNIITQKLSFFDITPVGKLLNRFTQDLVVIDDDLTFNLIASSDLSVKLIGALIVIVAVTKGYALIALIPIILLFQWIYQRFIHVNATLARFEAAARSPLFVHFTQSIVGLQSIRAFQCQLKFLNNVELHIDKLTHVTILQQQAVQWIVLRQSFLGALVMFAVGVIAITVGSDLWSPQYLAMALSYAIQLSNYIKSYVRQTAATECQFVSVQRVKEYCELKPINTRPHVVSFLAVATTMPPPPPPPSASASSSQETPTVAFRNVFLKYGRGPLALIDVSFSIVPGQRVGVVGRTG